MEAVPALNAVTTVLTVLCSLRGLKTSVYPTTVIQVGLDMFSVISVGNCSSFSKKLPVRKQQKRRTVNHNDWEGFCLPSVSQDSTFVLVFVGLSVKKILGAEIKVEQCFWGKCHPIHSTKLSYGFGEGTGVGCILVSGTKRGWMGRIFIQGYFLRGWRSAFEPLRCMGFLTSSLIWKVSALVLALLKVPGSQLLLLN